MTEDEMVGWHHRLSDLNLSKLWGYWSTGQHGVLQFMGLPRGERDSATE